MRPLATEHEQRVHLKIGKGTQIVGTVHVTRDTKPGSRMGGTPAQTFNEWARELATLKRLSRKRSPEHGPR